MIEPRSETSLSAEIDAEKHLSIKMIIAYLDEHLPDFPDFFKSKYPTTYTNESESILSQILCTFLNTFRKPDEVSLFDFEREWKSSRSAMDFAIIDVKAFKESIQKPKPFFTIEAKRLPPPEKDNKGESREREYVSGKSGGIERYKRGKHGGGLPQSSIIGYVQVETRSHWQTEINKWINNLVSNNTDTTIFWASPDLLKHVINLGKVTRYNSQNSRIFKSKKDSIELHHYLMELT